jgi:hypothetical protein
MLRKLNTFILLECLYFIIEMVWAHSNIRTKCPPFVFISCAKACILTPPVEVGIKVNCQQRHVVARD